MDSPIKLEELFQSEYGERKWLVENLLPESGIGILSGHPGSSKTWLLLHIAMAVASGGLVFGKFPTKQEKVLIVDEENRPALLKDRFQLLNAPVSLPIFLWVKSGFQVDDKQMTALLNFIYENDIKFVTFDSFVRIHSKDENDARSISEIFRTLSVLQSMGVTVLITHHHRKDSVNQPNKKSQSLRGSSDILANLDTHLSVDKKSKNLLEITQTKSRDAEEIGSFAVTVVSSENSVDFQYAGESVSTSKDMAKVQIMDRLKDFQEVTRNDLIALLKGSIGENAISDAVKELISESQIEERRGEKNKKFYSISNSAS